MQVDDYKFKTHSWPPPSDRQDDNCYLFGFDDDNQPYIVKWEEQPGSRGWIAATLANYQSNTATAVPRHFIGDTVDKLLKYWADAPLIKQALEDYDSGSRNRRIYRYGK